jgi:plastocyanin
MTCGTGTRGGRICLAPILLLAVVAILSLSVERAGADSTRVSITDFAWSKDPEIDLGESVIWDWLGPDTAHSVTGTGPGGVSIDSDPGSPFPDHRPGDTFTAAFDQPGQFTFACKIHSIVRGTVTVSDQPGDPDSDPGPQPPILFDQVAPDVREVRILRTTLGFRGRGTAIRFSSDERATADVEYFRLVRTGGWTVERFAGYDSWSGFIGYNAFPFARRSARFAARPGRYLARLRVADESGNSTRAFPLRFEIKAKPKKRRSRR